jgi:hypothetical protein
MTAETFAFITEQSRLEKEKRHAAKNAPRGTHKGGGKTVFFEPQVQQKDPQPEPEPEAETTKPVAKRVVKKKKKQYYSKNFDGLVCFKKLDGTKVMFGANQSRAAPCKL